MARLCTPGSPKTCRTPWARSASTIHSPPVRSSAEAVMVGSPADICGKGDQRCWEGLAPRAGLEPATPRLTAGCSTIELSGNSINGPARPLYVSQGLGIAKGTSPLTISALTSPLQLSPRLRASPFSSNCRAGCSSAASRLEMLPSPQRGEEYRESPLQTADVDAVLRAGSVDHLDRGEPGVAKHA